MERKLKTNYWVAISSGLIIFILDLFTKWWAMSSLFNGIIFIENFAYLVPYQKNDGIAFGIDIPLTIQIIGTVVVLIILLYVVGNYVFQVNRYANLKAILFGAVFGGALGNLINRILFGYVIDFILVKPIPVFNIADIGITVGLLALFATMLLDKK